MEKNSMANRIPEPPDIKTESDMNRPVDSDYFAAELTLLQAVRRGDRQEMFCQLRRLLDTIIFSAKKEVEQVKPRVYELLVMISREIINAGAAPEVMLEKNQQHFQALHRIGTMDELYGWMEQSAGNLMDSAAAVGSERFSEVIRWSIRYLHTHYAERITLKDISQKVHLSASYFGKMFKEETGDTFVAYLNRVRIERSKELMLRKRVRLTDVAQAVGFEEQSYFTRVFKRVVGVTPTRYREIHMS